MQALWTEMNQGTHWLKFSKKWCEQICNTHNEVKSCKHDISFLHLSSNSLVNTAFLYGCWMFSFQKVLVQTGRDATPWDQKVILFTPVIMIQVLSCLVYLLHGTLKKVSVYIIYRIFGQNTGQYKTTFKNIGFIGRVGWLIYVSHYYQKGTKHCEF